MMGYDGWMDGLNGGVIEIVVRLVRGCVVLAGEMEMRGKERVEDKEFSKWWEKRRGKGVQRYELSGVKERVPLSAEYNGFLIDIKDGRRCLELIGVFDERLCLRNKSEW